MVRKTFQAVGSIVLFNKYITDNLFLQRHLVDNYYRFEPTTNNRG